MIADVWKTAPFIGLLTLAGLQTIPAEVYEAAKVDGATAWQQFTRITLPMVKPTLVVAVLFRTLDTMRMFDLPYGMIGQGKYDVETLSIFAYQEANQPGTVRRRRTPSSCSSTCLLVAFLFVRMLGADVDRRRRATEEEEEAKVRERHRGARRPAASSEMAGRCALMSTTTAEYEKNTSAGGDREARPPEAEPLRPDRDDRCPTSAWRSS